MSRLARKPIPVPSNVEVALGDDSVTVNGPLGTLTRRVPSGIAIVKEGRELRITAQNDAQQTKMQLGTIVAHLKNMLSGSHEPFVKKLIVEGIGFKAGVKGDEVVLSLGFSHPVKVAIPKELKVTSEKGVIIISGADIEAVGAFAARIRALKKPEPYKGKGIRYEGEVIRRKQGKKTT